MVYPALVRTGKDDNQPDFSCLSDLNVGPNLANTGNQRFVFFFLSTFLFRPASFPSRSPLHLDSPNSEQTRLGNEDDGRLRLPMQLVCVYGATTVVMRVFLLVIYDNDSHQTKAISKVRGTFCRFICPSFSSFSFLFLPFLFPGLWEGSYPTSLCSWACLKPVPKLAYRVRPTHREGVSANSHPMSTQSWFANPVQVENT